MSPNKAPLFTEQLNLSCAGKIFVLGEYAVLDGMPAVIAAIGPRFEMHTGEGGRYPDFHPASPAGKLLAYATKTKSFVSDILHDFVDPHVGKGGFGASTAQFALLYRALAPGMGWQCDWRSVWSLYRELTREAGEGFPPSGADLVAQWQGGLCHFDIQAGQVADLHSELNWSNLLVFSATSQPGRKVATHDHLAALKAAGIPSGIRSPLNAGIAAIRSGDIAGLGTAMGQYAEVLSESGLEIEPTRQDRFALRTIPGVAGVKGAGAFQADAVLVLMENREADRAPVLEVARGRGLELVCSGLEFQKGVECHPV